MYNIIFRENVESGDWSIEFSFSVLWWCVQKCENSLKVRLGQDFVMVFFLLICRCEKCREL